MDDAEVPELNELIKQEVQRQLAQHGQSDRSVVAELVYRRIRPEQREKLLIRLLRLYVAQFLGKHRLDALRTSERRTAGEMRENPESASIINGGPAHPAKTRARLPVPGKPRMQHATVDEVQAWLNESIPIGSGIDKRIGAATVEELDLAAERREVHGYANLSRAWTYRRLSQALLNHGKGTPDELPAEVVRQVMVQSGDPKLFREFVSSQVTKYRKSA